VQDKAGYVVLSIQLSRLSTSACTMIAGLHKEALSAARAQAAALCSVLQGADVPVAAGLLEVHDVYLSGRVAARFNTGSSAAARGRTLSLQCHAGSSAATRGRCCRCNTMLHHGKVCRLQADGDVFGM
jgi:uncharacterized paraquat-inducible protein A